MNQAKLQSEIDTLKSFLEEYCSANIHVLQEYSDFTCKHGEFVYQVNTNLCKECGDLMRYSLLRLEECPHEIKPRCRNCSNPCYEKKEWTKLAKIMRFSGLRLGFVSLKNKVKNSLKKFM